MKPNFCIFHPSVLPTLLPILQTHPPPTAPPSLVLHPSVLPHLVPISPSQDSFSKPLPPGLPLLSLPPPDAFVRIQNFDSEVALTRLPGLGKGSQARGLHSICTLEPSICPYQTFIGSIRIMYSPLLDALICLYATCCWAFQAWKNLIAEGSVL